MFFLTITMRPSHKGIANSFHIVLVPLHHIIGIHYVFGEGKLTKKLMFLVEDFKGVNIYIIT